MDTILGLAILAVILAVLITLAKAGGQATREERQRQAAAQLAASQVASRHAQLHQARCLAHERLNRLFKQIQLALLTLDQVPDFRRAASWAQNARDVPLASRQRIFERFRPKMVEHVTRQIATRGDNVQLLESLTSLVQALGVPAFEADYIHSEAQQRRSVPTVAPPTFNQRLQNLRQAHESRMAALRALEGVDVDTKEQLMETEQSRFREAVLSLGETANAN